MSRLEISLLGSFDARLDGKPVTRFETETARALLAYLVLNPGVVFSRDKLAALLWDGPAEAGLNNLRPTLHRLRKAIETDESAHFLEVTRYSIKFEADSDYWLDVEELRGLLAAVQSHPHRRPSACPICLKRMERAVILYQDGLLMHFDPHSEQFHDWLIFEREQLRRQVVDVLEQLWEYYDRRGKFRWAEEYVRREVDLEPLNEEAHRRLMLTLALQGSRNEALAQYRQCEAILKRDFDLEPDADTKRLYEALKAGDDLPIRDPSLAPLHNLPVELTSFIGRQSEKEQLIEWMTDPDNRLVTITGLGGIGKTRLALTVAREMIGAFEDGVWWVSLADIGTEDLLLNRGGSTRDEDYLPGINALVNALTNALHLPDYSEKDRSRRLVEYLRPREVLLVIDRFEHLVELGREFIISLLYNAPRVYLLVTSRRRLNLQAERFLELSGLSVPDNNITTFDQANNPENGYASLRLFAERAGRAGRPFVLDEHNLPGVIEICQLVEGMPLAIELAAARIGRLSPSRIAQSIRDDLQSLSAELHDLPSRHRNLRSVFEGSWSLLAEDERQVLAGLAVFHNDFEADAAVQIVGAAEKIINSLADQSLIHISSDGRLQIHELLRQFAQEKQDSLPNVTDPRDQFCAYYLNYLAEREAGLYGEGPRHVSDEIGGEWDNIQDAWEWAASHGRLDDLQRGLKSLARFCCLKGWILQCKRLLETAIEHVSEILNNAPIDGNWPFTEMRVQSLLCWLYLVRASMDAHLGDEAHGEVMCRQAQQILTTVYDSQAYVQAGLLMSGLYRRQGKFKAAHDELNKLLSGTTLLLDQRASIFNAQGQIYFDQGKIGAAEEDFCQASIIYTQIGDVIGRTRANAMLGILSGYRGHIEETLHVCLEFLESSRRLGDRLGELRALTSLGQAYLTLGDEDNSYTYLEQALDLSRALGNRRAEAENLLLFGRFWEQQDDSDAAWLSMQTARELFAGMGHRGSEMDAWIGLGEISYQQGDVHLAQDMLNSTLGFFCEAEHQLRCGYIYSRLAFLAVTMERLDDGRELAEKAVDILEALSTDEIYPPLSAYVACIRTLRAIPDIQRADRLLRDAWNLLQAQAGRIQDPSLRALYLGGVPAHQEIIQLYKERGLNE